MDGLAIISAVPEPPTLWDFQGAALELALSERSSSSGFPFIEIPTGGGKGEVIGAYAAAMMPRGRVIVVAHLDAILLEPGGLADRLRKWCGADAIGIVKAKHDDVAAQVIAGSVQTLARPRRLAGIIEASAVPIVALAVDECHHAAAGGIYARTVEMVRAAFPAAVVVGFTATARPLSARPVPLFTRPIFQRQPLDLIRTGRLVPPVWRPLAVQMHLAGLVSIRGPAGELDYRGAELASAVSAPEVINAIVAGALAAIGDRKTIVFGASVAHARLLAEAFRAVGVSAEAVWGEQPADNRRAVLDAFRAGSLQIVTNYGVLGEGFDAPDCGAVVLARPTRSVTLARQQLGRGLRAFPGKTDCIVVEAVPRVADPCQVTVGAVLPLPEDAAGGGGGDCRSERRHLLDPRIAGEWRWSVVRGRGFDGFAAEAAPGLRLWLVSDPVSGLWRAGWTEQGARRRVVALLPAPSTLAEAQAMAARWLARHGSKWFGHDAAAWRYRPATHKQIAVIGRLLGRAADDGLMAGEASDLIAGFFADQDAEIVRTGLWCGRGGVYA